MNSITNNTMRVKRMNQEIVRQALKTMQQGTKSMIAQATGLSVATCGSILNELLNSGEIMELGLEQSSGGRPAMLYQYNQNFSYIACMIVRAGVKAHSLTYTIANLTGETIMEGHQEHERINPSIIYQTVDQLIDQFPQIRAIGIGIPGAVNQGVVNVSDIQELINIPLEAAIREKHGVEVILDNDMNLTVYGFYQKQGYEEEKSLAVVTFIEGSFPGAGMMVDGHIYRGSTRFAGEIAFLPLGISLEELYQQLHDRSTFHSIAGRSVSSLIAIMNPELVALTGSLVEYDDVELIRQECLKYIPEMHIPQLTLLEHPEEDYMYGLITMTLESLAYSLQLVEKRR